MVTISKNNNKFKFSLAALVAVAALSLNLSICSINTAVAFAVGTGPCSTSAGSSTSNGADMTAGTSFNFATAAISDVIGKTIDTTFSMAGAVFVVSGSLVQSGGLGINYVGEWTKAKLKAYPTFTTCLTAAGAVGVYLFMQKRR